MLNGGLVRCLLVGVALLLLGCRASTSGSSEKLSGEGESCTKTADCESGLKCVALVCVADGTAGKEEPAKAEAKKEEPARGEHVEAVPPNLEPQGPKEPKREESAKVEQVKVVPLKVEPQGPKWITIPGGTFRMGCSPNDADCDSDEKPAHSVSVSSFEMLETEVTEAQYQVVMDGNPSCNRGGGGGADNPVECVDWDNAKAFCKGIGGRLPTEAEWEYAARGGTTTRYYCGDDPECLNDIAWYDKNSSGMKHSVKKKKPNGYGLYDMLGNVWEWTNDMYDASYYKFSPSSDPQGPDRGDGRAPRGGSFNVWYGFRVSERRNPGNGIGIVGLRCARSLAP